MRFFDDIINNTIAFSPDSRRFAFAAADKKNEFAVCDGKPLRKFDKVGKINVLFSPDSKKFIYTARENDGWKLIIDGSPCGKKYHGIIYASIRFSPDLKNISYCVRIRNKFFAVCNGKTESPAYDSIISPPEFIESDKISFIAVRNNTAYRVMQKIIR